MIEKSCHNCVNESWITKEDGSLDGCCEEYVFYKLGFPANITPPYDDACELWTDDPDKKNTWEKVASRIF